MIDPDAGPAPDPLAERNAARRAAILEAFDRADAPALLALAPTAAEKRALWIIRAARSEFKERTVWHLTPNARPRGRPRTGK